MTTVASPENFFSRTRLCANDVSNVLTKLDVEDRAEAMARARNAGLGG
jgi:hypothetical protein